ncbi:MAG TPA: tyrosine--tRNA ligase [Candidatus Limnocylindria bacterium]|jgi:tyrosyl-tRNA synthetase
MDQGAAIELLLTRRVAQVVERDALAALLRGSRPLRVKLGIDPTSADLHIGHGVVLERLRAFQELGHTAVLVVGDTTAQIGDPSEKNTTRPMLTADEVRANAETYLAQFHLVVDASRTEVRWQSEWFDTFRLKEVFSLLSRFTLARMIERDTFAKRLAEGAPVSMHETLYPLLQAFDSVAVEADVELGGTDQTFNLLVGRDVQRDYGQPPQQIMTSELLVGTDGIQKMSKSLGNAIGLTDPAYEMYARTMSIPDGLLANWAGLVTRWSEAETSAFVADVEADRVHPKAAKQQLAREIVGRWHGEDAAAEAEGRWEREVGGGEGVDVSSLEEVEVSVPLAGISLPDLLVVAGLASSRGVGRRLVRQGGVRVDGVVQADENRMFEAGITHEVRVGKRSAALVRLT